MLMRLDVRQELFDEFRKGFNSLEGDMRYDPDCIAELYLQTIELGEAIFRMCDQRRNEADEYLETSIKSDGVVYFLMHRCKCEAISLIQSEINRFYVILHLLFDSTKALQSYPIKGRIYNSLEITLDLPGSGSSSTPSVGKANNSKDKDKDKKKGGKGAVQVAEFTPYREVIANNFIPIIGMKDLREEVLDQGNLYKSAEVASEPTPVKGGNSAPSSKQVINIISFNPFNK
jgi:hypothetical protein